MATTQDQLKKEAAIRAVEYVQEGMTLGLGTGSTAEYAVREIGRRVAQEGLHVRGVPTSERVGELAASLNIALCTLAECPRLDLTIDGADEVVLSTLDVIKGMGGALLREKIVALSTIEEILIVDETKVVPFLGHHTALPVEVVPFGWTRTHDELIALGCTPHLRTLPDSTPYITDGGDYLLDCTFPGIHDPAATARTIKQITGVVEHGLFVGIVRRVVVAQAGGVQVYEVAGKRQDVRDAETRQG